MRPVDRGESPQREDFENFRDAFGPLVGRLGPYCSYCERRICTDLAVEHIQPKDVDLYPELEGSWNNYLLACKNCNSTKGHKDVLPENYYLPDRDNTLAAFDYLPDGSITPSVAAAAPIAADTLKLTGLDKPIRAVFDENGQLVASDRIAQSIALTPQPSRFRRSDNRVDARHIAHDAFDLGDQGVRCRRLIVFAVDLDCRGRVDIRGRRLGGDLVEVLPAVHAVGYLADCPSLTGDFDQLRVVGKRSPAFIGLDAVIEEMGTENPERIFGFVGDAQRRRAGPRRIVLVLLAVENGDHGVVGRNGSDVDELGYRRSESPLEITAGRTQEILVERDHGLGVVRSGHIDHVIRRNPHRIALPGGRALLVVMRYHYVADDGDREDHDERGAEDLDEPTGFAGGRLQVESRGRLFVGHRFADPHVLDVSRLAG